MTLKISKLLLIFVFLLIKNISSYTSEGKIHTFDTWEELAEGPPSQRQASLFETVEIGEHVPNYNDSVQTGEFIDYHRKLYADKFLNDEEGSHNMAKYNRELIPTPIDKEWVDVEILMDLIKIQNFDTSAQTLELVSWIILKWQDPQLAWNASEYGGIKTMKVKPSSVWIPDLTLYNAANGAFQLAEDPQNTVNLHVYDNGVVRWVPVVSLTVACPLNLEYFPFDYQTCFMKLGSWSFTYDRLRFHMVTNAADLSYMSPSHTWQIKANYVINNIVYYTLGGFQDLKFTFIIARNPSQYVINIIMTCAFLVFLSGLTFMVPCASGERLSAVLSLVIAISVYQMTAADVIPKGADTLPILSYFVTTELYMVFFCAIITMLDLLIETGVHPARPNKWLFFIVVDILGTPTGVKHCTNYKRIHREFKNRDEDYVVDDELKIDDLLERKRLIELRRLEWFCIEKVVERVSWATYWVAFLISTAIIWWYNNSRNDQMKKEFDKLFNEENGLAFT